MSKQLFIGLIASRQLPILRRLLVSRWLLALLLLVLPATLGCRPARHARPVVDQPGAADEVLALAAHLPADDTIAVVATPNFGALLELAGTLAAEDEAATQREELALILTEMLGSDLTRRGGWEQLGIDTTAPAVAGLLAAPDVNLLLTLRLRDPGKLRHALYSRRSELNLRRRLSVRGGVLVMQGRDGSIALFERTAVVALGERAAELIERVAALRPEVSFAQRADFKRRVKGVEGGGELWLYAPPRGFVYWTRGLDARWRGANLKETAEQVELMHRRMLAAARDRGATAAELSRIDERYRSALAGLRDEPSATLLRKYFGALPGAVLSLRLRGDHPRAAGRLFLPDKAPLGSLLRGQEPPRWDAVVGEGMQLTGRFDPTTLRELQTAFDDSFAEQWRETPDELKQALRASLDGRVLMFASRGQGAMRLGLTDAQAGSRLLDALRKSDWSLDGGAAVASNGAEDDGSTAAGNVAGAVGARRESTNAGNGTAGGGNGAAGASTGAGDAVRIRVGRQQLTAQLQGTDLVLQSGRLMPPAWPQEGVSQLSMQLALAEWVMPASDVDVLSMSRTEPPARDPAVPVSERYRAGLAELAKLRADLDEAVARYRVSLRRQKHKAGALKLSARFIDGHIDVAIALQGGKGLSALLGIWSVGEDGGELQALMQSLDEIELKILELRRIYADERKAHEEATAPKPADGDGAAAGGEPKLKAPGAKN